MWYLRALSEGRGKPDSRWEDGVFVGFREESGEIYVLTPHGARKVRDNKRRPEEERWNQEAFSAVQGAPWEPEPGKTNVEVRAHFSIKDVRRLRRSRYRRSSNLEE